MASTFGAQSFNGFAVYSEEKKFEKIQLADIDKVECEVIGSEVREGLGKLSRERLLAQAADDNEYLWHDIRAVPLNMQTMRLGNKNSKAIR